MIKWLWRHSFLYYLVSFISSKIEHRRDKKRFGEVFYGGYFHSLAAKYLKTELEQDWIGRLYGIINPNTDIDGNFDPGTVIIEMDGENTNNNEYVKTWIYKQLRLMASLFSLKEFYEKISMDITHVGPEELDNYLIVFDFESRQQKAFWRKKLFWRSFFLAAIAAVTILTTLYFK